MPSTSTSPEVIPSSQSKVVSLPTIETARYNHTRHTQRPPETEPTTLPFTYTTWWGKVVAISHDLPPGTYWSSIGYGDNLVRVACYQGGPLYREDYLITR